MNRLDVRPANLDPTFEVEDRATRRLVKRIATMRGKTGQRILEALQDMFAD